jgi:hypothetical protein
MIKAIALALMAGGTVVAADSAWKASLHPTNNSKVEGSADVKANGTDATMMSVKIKNASAGTTYAWHMHSGTCAAGGPVVGDAMAYPKLTADSTGVGRSEATISVSPPASGDHSIHVHAPSPDAMKPGLEVACGDLKPVRE